LRCVLLLCCLFPLTAAGAADETVLALVDRAEPKCRELAAQLAACRAAGADIAEPDAALAVAELFCRYSRADATRPPLCAAAVKSMTYVDHMLDAELKRADEVLAGRATYPRVPPWHSAVGVTWHDGGFFAGDQPLFLSGLNWDQAEAERHPELLKRLGITLTDGMFRDGAGGYLARMTQAGLTVDTLLGFRPPASLISGTPGLAAKHYGNGIDYVVDAPPVVAACDQFLDRLGAQYSLQPSLFAVDLANEPCFQGPAEFMLANWRAWLKRKYGDVATLNAAWGTQLTGFEAVTRYPSQPAVMKSQWDRGKVDFDQPGVRGAHYDWCAFNNERISAWFAEQAARLHAIAPRLATHVKVMLGLYFTGSTESRGWPMGLSYHTFGIDPEALAKSQSFVAGDLDLVDLAGVAKPNRRFGSVPYVCGWLDAALAADFSKSMAPDKPFYNSELHVPEDNSPTGDPAASSAHLRTALWLTHLHGMAGNILWYWGRNGDGAPAGEWFPGSMLQQPWLLQTYAQEMMRLNAHASEIMAFARAPRPVRLLYSEPSAIGDVHYLDALRDAYEALNFLGVSIGFVTERQLAEGTVSADTKLIIVPNARYVADETVSALRAARGRGVQVALLDDQSLTFTPTGRPRGDSSIPGVLVAPRGEPRQEQAVLARWLTAAGIAAELEALDGDGRPAWGVEARTARRGDERLAYLVNLMREPVTVRLRAGAGEARVRDWATDAVVGPKVTLAPRRVVAGEW
jgi:beta-galactosidase